MKSPNTPNSGAVIEGIINVLKPPGMTSSDVVSDIRKLFETKRVGHAGTLDPGAAGVLPITLGRATRLFDLLIDKEKEYICEIAFGSRTDTQDSYGRITERDDVSVSEEDIHLALCSFSGGYLQTAPAYSALKSGGKSLYALARAGQEVPVREREVTIHALELIAKTGENRFLLRVRCSRGTYIRTLCEDIGRYLRTCAHMSFLLRNVSGAFCVKESFSIAELALMREEGRLFEAVVPIERVLDFLPSVRMMDQPDIARLKNGCTVEPVGADIDCPEGDLCRVYATGLLGVGVRTRDGLKLKLHLWPGEQDA